MASTARDVMTVGAECVNEDETLAAAAQKMAELGVGAVPICGSDDKLKGIVTDRDIVVECVARGGDPASTKAGSLADGKPVTIGADDSLEEALRTMAEHQVRRLPVIDGQDLVGMVSLADLARALPEDASGDLIEAISQP
jgi:CBS domain-containing protein